MTKCQANQCEETGNWHVVRAPRMTNLGVIHDGPYVLERINHERQASFCHTHAVAERLRRIGKEITV